MVEGFEALDGLSWLCFVGGGKRGFDARAGPVLWGLEVGYLGGAPEEDGEMASVLLMVAVVVESVDGIEEGLGVCSHFRNNCTDMIDWKFHCPWVFGLMRHLARRHRSHCDFNELRIHN